MQRTGQGKTAVVGWGRGMGHKGHMMLASSVITQAGKVGGDPYFVVSKTVGKDDPITPDEKIAIYKKVFPQSGHIFQPATDEIPDLTRVLANLNQQGYTNVTVVLGADQVKAFQYLKNYNNKPDKSGNILYSFDSLDVISRQETGDPSAGEEGPRATPMRQVLMDPSKSEQEQFAVWRDAMSPEIGDDEVRALMAKAKERMTAMSAPKPKKAKVAEQESPAMAHTAKSLENPPKVMQHRARRDQERDKQWMGTQIAKNDRTSKDEWGDFKEGEQDPQSELKMINQKLKDAYKQVRNNSSVSIGWYMSEVKELKARREELIKQLRQGVAEADDKKEWQKQNAKPKQLGKTEKYFSTRHTTKDTGAADKEQGVAEGSGGNWYIRVNGKILNDTKFKPVIFSSEGEARSHAMKLADKKRIPLSQMKLTKSWMDAPEQGVAEGSLNEFAPDGFNGSDDEGFSPEIAKMAQEDGFTKGAGLADGATLERAMTINHWHSQHGGMYKQYFAKGFKSGRMNKINHDNKQYNLNLKLMKDGSIRHGEQGVAESETNYDSEWDEKVKRVGQMAKEGPRKTVWDPVKRVYKTVPVNAPQDKKVPKPVAERLLNSLVRPLKINEDAGVLKLQQMLISKGARIEADGIMGPLTRAAMKQFGGGGASAPTKPVAQKTPALSKPGVEKKIAGVVTSGPGYTDVKTTDGELQRREGTRNWRNNNPGNIRKGGYAQSKGAVGDDGAFAVFPSLEVGMDAKEALIFGPKYINLSIQDAISRYAPPSENDTQGYIKQVCQATGTTPDITLSKLNPAQRDALLKTISKVEGFKVGNIKVVSNVAEGIGSTLAGLGLAGAMALGGAGHAQAADLSNFNTQYLQQVVSGEHPRPMVSIDDAKAELQARTNGKQQTVSPAASNANSGFSKEWLQKAADPNRVGRYLISVEKAQDLLSKMNAVDEAKIKGADGKACWDGYRYNGTAQGKDKCVKVSESVEDIMDNLINKIITNEAIQNNRR